MEKKKRNRIDTDGLRRLAEAKLEKQTKRLLEISKQGMDRLIHELGTHQIELEMQNEELRRSQTEMEASRQRYADLYDFAPVGYFTLDRDGVVTGANRTGSVMLGRAKRSLISSRFADFVILQDIPVFQSHLDESSQSFGLIGIKERVRSFDGKVVIEGVKDKGTSVTVRIPRKKHFGNDAVNGITDTDFSEMNF